MRLSWLPNSWKDYLYWQENDKKILLRVNDVIKGTLRNPYSGIGKPEPLKNNLKGWCSRRITQEHRLVYKVEADIILIMQCRFHFDR
jgi:toxin YoeB